jgi:[ribosomal protein S18]-alanine N-acetyltransferase
MTNMKVRSANLSDIPAIMQIEQVCYEFPWVQSHFETALQQPNCLVMCLEKEKNIVGYFVVLQIPEELHLLNITVDVQHHNQGLCHFMLDWLFAYSHSLSIKIMLLEVRPSNLAARHIYEKLGFKVIGTRKGYYPAKDGREDGFVMSKDF